MMRMGDSVNDGIPHIDVRRCHIDFRPQNPFAVGEFSGAHTLKQRRRLFSALAPAWALLSGLLQRSPIFPDLIGTQVVNISQTLADQLHRRLIHGVEIIRGPQAFIPREPEPLHIFLDGIHILHVLFHRISIVVPEIRPPAVLLCGGKVQTDGFGVADMKVAVGFRRKTGIHLSAVGAFLNILLNNLMDEIQRPVFICFLAHFLLRSVSCLQANCCRKRCPSGKLSHR